ncbi:MAG: ferrous iron transport protein A [Clostridia bacterium]|nr:ferrous iron transport protein A [Clostridia bacterium]
MTDIIPISSLRIGESGVVKVLFAEENIKRRLLDIGLIEGTKISCVLKSPSGDPLAYLIRGAVIALRKEDTANILVDTKEGLWD